MTSLNFLFWVTIGRNFKPVEPRFPHRAKTWEQKLTELGTILTILNLTGGNMDIGEPSLSSSQPFSISSSGWLWVEVSDLLCFYAFSTLLLLAFWFSLVKAPLTFVFYTLWILGLILHKQTLLKNLRGDLSRFCIFGSCRKTSRHFGDSAGESSCWYKRNGASKGVEPAKRWRFSHQLVIPREIFFWTFVVSILIISCQSTINLCFLYIVNFGLDSP